MFEIGWVVLWYLASLVLGALAFPISYVCFSQLPDRGYSVARVVGLFSAGWLIWLLGTLGIYLPVATGIGVVALAGVSGYIFVRQKKEIIVFLKQKKNTLLVLEIVFLASFVAFSAVRAMSPSIYGAEKFMDMAIFSTSLRAERLPLGDVWNENEPMKYHWFGHMLLALFSKGIGVPREIGYNLSLAFLFALSAMIAFNIGLTLTKRWWLALLGLCFVVVFGNLAGSMQLVEGNWQGFNAWNPTRVIDSHTGKAAISEFPFFSFWWADLHAHVIAIPLVLALVVLAFQVFRAGLTKPTGALAIILFGSLKVANAWDWPSAAFLLGLVVLWRWWKSGTATSFFMNVALPWGIVTGASLLIFYGFPSAGLLEVEMTTIKSVIKEWLLVFGPFAFLTMAYIPSYFQAFGWLIGLLLVFAMVMVPVWLFVIVLIVALIALLFLEKMPEERVFGQVLAITGFCLLLFIELFYLKDWLSGGYQRMNTLFKFGLHGWLLLGLAMPVFVQSTWENLRRARLAFMCLVGVLIIAGLAFPFSVIAQKASSSSGLTLDGWTDLRRDHPAEFAAIDWLNQNIKGNPVVLEAPGESYTYGNRVSTNTGLPTVVGWPSHLYQHGVAWDYVYAQRDNVTKIYNSTSMDVASPLLKQYNVQYVFVGEIEKNLYNSTALEKFKSLPVAFETNGVVIYRAA